MQRDKNDMQEYLQVLKKTKLFSGLSDKEALSVLKCLNAKVLCFDKNQIIFEDGSTASFIGVILSGEVQTRKTDYNGNTNIVYKLYPAEIIAASVCYSTSKRLPFDIVSVAQSQVLSLDPARLIMPCPSACVFHSVLIKNLMNIVADRNIFLASKIDLLTKRSLREKVLSYLLLQQKRAGKKSFSVPLSRRQMAEYLSVNRSALSRELCLMRDEGLISFKDNSFTLS